MQVQEDVCSLQKLQTGHHLFSVKYNQKVESWFLAIELPLFSKIMQTRYHLKELSMRNFILARVLKFWLLKGACDECDAF